jgi:hypothetical protein
LLNIVLVIIEYRSDVIGFAGCRSYIVEGLSDTGGYRLVVVGFRSDIVGYRRALFGHRLISFGYRRM